ncbi:MAG: ribonuclease [Phycisphaerales bacterium]|nr:ribonuclease [Phycisphaerales bacterium]
MWVSRSHALRAVTGFPFTFPFLLFTFVPMARLSDVRKVIKSVGLIRFGMRVWDEVNKDNLFVWASALAYSWLFAIFPFFLFLLALVQHLPQNSTQRAEAEITKIVEELFPQPVASMFRRNINGNERNLLHEQRGTLLYVGLIVAVWAASGGTVMTMSALDRVYEIEKGRPAYQHRLLGILLTIVVIVLLVVVVCLLPVATLVKAWIIHVGGVQSGSPVLIVFDTARWSVSVLLMFVVLTVVYHKGPAIRHRFVAITPGAVFVVIVWVVLGLLFRLYVDRIGAKGYSKTYGAVGAVAILLLSFYIDALVLLIGAEINSEIDFEVLKVRRGTRDFRSAEDLSMGAPTAC